MLRNNSAIKVGIIGLGVGEQHIYGYELHPKCKVVKICDFNKDKLSEVKQRHPNCKAELDPNEILNDPSIDIVSIASFDNFHFSQIMQALDNDKHVFVEKPLCLTRDEYEGIVEKLKEKNHLQLSSNLILRKTNRFRKLRKKIVNKELGNIYLYEASYDYGRIHKITSGWRGEIDNYSVMHSGGIHLIDIILWLSNQKIIEVNAISTKIATANSNFRYQDCISAQLKFEDGAIGNVTANFPSVTKHGHRLVIHGDLGTFYHGPLGSAYFFDRAADSKPIINNDNYPGVKKGDMIFSFVESILNSTNPEVTKNEVFEAMNVSLAIEESLHRGKIIKLDY